MFSYPILRIRGLFPWFLHFYDAVSLQLLKDKQNTHSLSVEIKLIFVLGTQTSEKYSTCLTLLPVPKPHTYTVYIQYTYSQGITYICITINYITCVFLVVFQTLNYGRWWIVIRSMGSLYLQVICFIQTTLAVSYFLNSMV